MFESSFNIAHHYTSNGSTILTGIHQNISLAIRKQHVTHEEVAYTWEYQPIVYKHVLKHQQSYYMYQHEQWLTNDKGGEV